jgi:hypothetical protein
VSLVQSDGIKVDVDGDRVTVTLEGTTYRAVFFLCPDKGQLIQSNALAVD